MPKNWFFWTMVLEKTLESVLNCKEIQPDHPKGNQSWIFIGRTGAEAETWILWQPDMKNWLFWINSDAGKDWRQKEKGMTDGWVASLTLWTWVWLSSRSWWWTGKPGILQSMGSQRVRHDWATELFTDLHENSAQKLPMILSQIQRQRKDCKSCLHCNPYRSLVYCFFFFLNLCLLQKTTVFKA